MSLEEEVECEGVGDGGVDNGTGGQVAGSVEVALVETEEAHVVTLGADDKSDLLVRTSLFVS